MSDPRGPSLTVRPGHARHAAPGMRARQCAAALKVRPRNLRHIHRQDLGVFPRGTRPARARRSRFILLDSALGMAGPYLIGRGVDAIAGHCRLPDSHRVAAAFGALQPPLRALSLAAFALLAAYLGGALLQTTEGWIMAGISQRMVRNIREGLFDKMQRLPLAFYDTRPHGDLMSRLTNDVDAVSVTVSQSAVQLMSGVVVVAGTLVDHDLPEPAHGRSPACCPSRSSSFSPPRSPGARACCSRSSRTRWAR